jgi:hypothetical protein
MKALILPIVIIAALFAIVSGVWVATALVRAISAPRPPHSQQPQPDNAEHD